MATIQKWTKRQQKAHRKALVKALREDGYLQTKGRLTEARPDGNDSFCCLGVACNISDLGKWRKSNFGEEWAYVVGMSSDYSYLPEPVRAYFGFVDRYGNYKNSKGHRNSLTEQNDGWGGRRRLSFKQIANIIEREPKELVE